MDNKYLKEFYGYNCHDDVLASVSKLHNVAKEITESMAIIKRLKPIVLKNPDRYEIFDFCAGNALTSVLAVHLLPILGALAIDKQKRKGNYERVRDFFYIEGDINHIVGKDKIIISVHPCKTAEKIVDIFVHSQAKALIMMPCCEGSTGPCTAGKWLKDKIGRYNLWTYYLAQRIKSEIKDEDPWETGRETVQVFTDKNVLSPKNNVIVAVRN